MNFQIQNLIDSYNYNADKAAVLSDFRIRDVLYRKQADFVIIKAENNCVLPYSIYNDIMDYFHSLGFANLKLYIKAADQELPIREINLYLDEYRKNNPGFHNCVPVISEKGFELSYDDKNAYENDLDLLDELKLFFYDLGYRKDISLIYQKYQENSFLISLSADTVST